MLHSTSLTKWKLKPQYNTQLSEWQNKTTTKGKPKQNKTETENTQGWGGCGASRTLTLLWYKHLGKLSESSNSDLTRLPITSYCSTVLLLCLHVAEIDAYEYQKTCKECSEQHYL